LIKRNSWVINSKDSPTGESSFSYIFLTLSPKKTLNPI
jgi:hypothetical protein